MIRGILFNLPRILKILWILSKNHIWFGYKKSKDLFGKRLTKSLEELGPSFIKLGQTLSVRPDIVGYEITQHLSKLQDKVPPFPFKEVEKIIENELGGKITDKFALFHTEPLAAASIAQVHRARSFDHQEVAVKILRPGIERKIRRDIELFYLLARLCEKYIKSMRRLKPLEVVKLFEEIVSFELDLRLEAAAADEMKENFAGDNRVKIPQIHWSLTSKRILTMESVKGIAVSDKEALHYAAIDNKKLATNLAICFFNQAYRDGFFHADLHPGNIFIGEKGEIILIDFGITGRLDRKTRIYLGEILRGFVRRDYYKVAQIHHQAGYIPHDTCISTFAQACRSIGEPIFGLEVNQISVGKLLAQLFEITKRFSMETQPQLLLFQKTMVLIEGIGSMLYPNVNMWQLAEPWIEEWAKDNLGIEAQIRSTIAQGISLVKELPDIIHQFHLYLEKKNAKYHEIEEAEKIKKSNG